MCKIILSLTILCLWLHHGHPYRIPKVKTSEYYHFDVIVLSQQWPATVCLYYKHVVSPGGGCFLPKKKNHWSIHGIWPRKLNGPYTEFCNDSWPFDPEQIESIESGLNHAQFSIYKLSENPTPYIYWAHEWDRHGTCAALFEPFNTQLKYFSKSIEWNNKYALSDMLEAANIYPSDTKYLDPEEVASAVKAVTKKDPMIGCYEINGVTYLQEVRICLDKTFNLMDCKRPVVDKYCKSSKGFIYPVNK